MPKNSSEGRQTVRTRIEFEIFAKIIRKQRLRAKMSQWALSEKIGRSKSYVGKFESGKVYPDFITGLDLISALELNAGDVAAQIENESKKDKR